METKTKTEEQICPIGFCSDNRSGKVMKKGTMAFIAFLSLIFVSGCSSGLNFEMPDLFGSKESDNPKKAPVASKETPKEKEVSKGGMFYPHLFKGKEDTLKAESKKTASSAVGQNGASEKLSSEELLNAAGSAYQAGKYYDASRKYVSWLHYYEKTARQEDKALACNRLGNIARKRQQYQVSLEYYEKAITFSSAKNTEYLYDVAETLYELEKYPEAQQYFLKVLKLDPQLAQAEKYYGLCLMNQGREECFTPLIQTMGEVNACRLIAEKSYESEKLVLAEKAETRMKEAATREGISVPVLRNKPDPNLAAKKEILFPRREQLNAAAPISPAAPVTAAAPISPAAPVTAAAPISPAAPVTAAAPIASAAPVTAAAPIASAAPVTAAAPIAPVAPVITAAPIASLSNPLLASASVTPTVNTKPVLQSAAIQTPAQVPVTTTAVISKKGSSASGLPQLKVESSPLLESLGVNNTTAVASAIPSPAVGSPVSAPVASVASAIPSSAVGSPVSAPVAAVTSAVPSSAVGSPVSAPVAAVTSAVPSSAVGSPVLAPVAPVASAVPSSAVGSPVLAPVAPVASAVPSPAVGSPVLAPVAPVASAVPSPVTGQVTAVSAEIVFSENNVTRDEILVYDSSEKPFPVRIITRQSAEYQKLSVFYQKQGLNRGGADPMNQTALNKMGSAQNNGKGQDSKEDFSNLTMSFLKSGFDLALSDETVSISKEAVAFGGQKSSSFDETSDFGFAQSGAYTRPGNLPQQFSAQLSANTGRTVPDSVLKEQTKREIEMENRNKSPRPIPTTIPNDGAAVPIPVSNNNAAPQSSQDQNEINNVLTKKTDSLSDNAKVNTEKIDNPQTTPVEVNNVVPFQQVAGKGLRSLF